MERLKVKELKALSKRLGLKGYSKLNKSDLIKLLMEHLDSKPASRPRNDFPNKSSELPKAPTPTQPSPPPPVRLSPRQPSPQEMDIFEQQEMSKS